MKPLKPVYPISILLLLGAGSARAQFGTTSMQSPVHARTIGMGQVGTSDNSDPSTIFFNPANVVAPPRGYLVGSREDFDYSDNGVQRGDGGGSWKFDPSSAWTFGANATYARLDLGDNFFPGSLDDNLVGVTLGAGATMSTRAEIHFGAGIKRAWGHALVFDYLIDDFVATEFDGYSYDAGMTAVFQASDGSWDVTPQVGIALLNAGPDFDIGGYKRRLPQQVNLGMGLRMASPLRAVGSAQVPMYAIVCSADMMIARNDDSEIAVGTEVGVAQILFLRGGLQLGSNVDDTLAWGVGLGIPINSFRARFDYGDNDVQGIDQSLSLLIERVF